MNLRKNTQSELIWIHKYIIGFGSTVQMFMKSLKDKIRPNMLINAEYLW